MIALPIDAALPQVVAALRAHAVTIVVAPTGSGKTSRVPPALLDAGLAGPGKILVLQPRRVAARLAAARMAQERGGAVGQEVGYAVRFDRKISAQTRIEVLTEGLLTRRVQADPFLEGVGVVVLDEVHERSVHTDLALGLLADVLCEARDDLKLVLMSATVDPAPLVAWLDGLGVSNAVVQAQGRAFPVEIRHVPAKDERWLEKRVAAAVREVLDGLDGGHVLVFLPGVGEIQRAAAELGDLDGRAAVLPLHGRLPGAAQDRALAPSRHSKVVLATNIAESSVTLPGVAVVVDSGLERAAVFDPAIGLTRLLTQPISVASADQRAGRAGRTGPGLCVRLWTLDEHRQRRAAPVPELERVDLGRVVLEVRAWGKDPADWTWLGPPPPGGLARADALLTQLGALEQGQLTASGRELAALPLSPRLGVVVREGHARGCLGAAAAAAALATERDPWTEGRGAADLLLRLEWMRTGAGRPDRRALARVRRTADLLVRVARAVLGPGGGDGGADAQAVIRCLRMGFPDRVGRRRSPDSARFRLASGAGARLPGAVSVGDPEWILGVVLQGGHKGVRSEHTIRVWAPIDPEGLPTETVEHTWFDWDRKSVRVESQTRFGALVCTAKPTERPDPVAVAACLADAAATDPGAAFSMSAAAQGLCARVGFLAHHRPDLGLPPLPDWARSLPILCAGRRSFADLRKLDLAEALLGRLDWSQRGALDKLAPTHLVLPTGSRARIRYGAPADPPVMGARIQQLFGWSAHPRVVDGRVALTLELLAPNNRPMQITSDLPGFWAGSYVDVRKDLRGRYPKHAWPEDPASARPEDRPRRSR